jgi:hypothetical protein
VITAGPTDRKPVSRRPDACSDVRLRVATGRQPMAATTTADISRIIGNVGVSA